MSNKEKGAVKGVSTTTKKLVFSAMAVALSMVTSYIKVIDMPMGGSVTLLSMLFICLIGYWYGPKTGLITGAAYGILQFIVDPYMFSIPQVLIDYPLAFGALGLSGFFHNKKHGLILGYITGVLGRYICAIFSGVVFFASYAPDNMNPFLYSAVYNGSYLGAEAVITLIILALPPVSKGLAHVKAIVHN